MSQGGAAFHIHTYIIVRVSGIRDPGSRLLENTASVQYDFNVLHIGLQRGDLPML